MFYINASLVVKSYVPYCGVHYVRYDSLISFYILDAQYHDDDPNDEGTTGGRTLVAFDSQS